MNKTLRTWSILLASLVAIRVSAQGNQPVLETLLRNAPHGRVAQVFGQLEAAIDTLPYKEAIANEDALLHVAAELPDYQEAFGWIYGLTKTTYTDAGHEANLFLYLLSIADDPAFQKPAIRTKISYEIGLSYYSIGDYEKAQVMLDKFIDAYNGPVNRDLVNGLTMLGFIYEGRHNFEQAGYFFRLALDKAAQAKDTIWIGLANGNLGGLYLETGKLAESQALIYRDVVISLHNKLYESAANDYCDLSTIALRQGRFPQVRMALDSAFLLLRLTGEPAPKSLAAVYKNLGRYYFASGRPDSAYHYLQASQQILDSLQNDHNESMLKLRVSTFSQQKAEQDALLLKVSVEKSRANQRVAIISVIGILVVSAFALMYIRQKKRINRVLRERAASIEEERRLEEERRKKEEAANHAKDKLFSLIAHDLRGPIGSLVMMLDIMQKGSLSPQEFMTVLPDIKNKVGNLYKVTDNLLHWAYAQMGGSSSQREPVSIAIPVKNVFTLLQDDAAKKGIELRHALPAGMTITADPHELEIVIRNLVSNALKFSPRGSVVSVEGLLTGQQAVIQVKDSGPGLPDSVLRNLQEGKFSSPSRGTAGEKGAGLGLVMCKEFVETNGGRLEASSPATGTGTVFTIFFPVA